MQANLIHLKLNHSDQSTESTDWQRLDIVLYTGMYVKTINLILNRES